MYLILYTYETGDSWSRREEFQTLELEWEDLNAAKAAFKAIVEHYKFYKEYTKLRFNQDKSLILKGLTDYQEAFPWFVSGKDKEGCVKLKTDSGEDYQFSAPWCGYHEKLLKLEIVDTDLDKMTF